ncbi:class I SAM-dependent methyltransferase [Micromonospora sp. NPDC047740]|uniref:class I SAM-dependent methyltransferase n=1 Tax=Micromonospora sp. NPDC047740 TaxID=3364254 RepID=UPI00371A0E90
MTLLSPEENAAYWNRRHLTEGYLRSGGDMSYDEGTNRMFYILRLGLLLDIIGHNADPVAPLYLLDAGCGKGWFSRQLAQFGHQVDGIDASESAIAYCRDRGGPARFHVSPLSQWRSPWFYDVVLAVDVLFHVLADDEWERSVRNLASLVGLGGRLVVSDWGEPDDRVYGDYQVVRGTNRYLPLLSECGLRSDGWRPYAFRQNPIGFHVFTREH